MGMSRQGRKEGEGVKKERRERVSLVGEVEAPPPVASGGGYRPVGTHGESLLTEDPPARSEPTLKKPPSAELTEDQAI